MNQITEGDSKLEISRPKTRTIQVKDGRQITYCEYGDPKGTPIFYFHSTPGSRYEPALGDQAGRNYGYRIIALDRLGIGASD